MENVKRRTPFYLLVLLLTAGMLHAQAQTAGLHFRHAANNLARIAEDFGKQFKVRLAYANEELSAVKVPAASFEAASIGELLNKVLAPGHFKAIVNGDSWIIRKDETPRTQATMTLRGLIREGDNAVPSATVIIKQNGTPTVIAVADENGSFSKKLPLLEGTVEISAVGYLPARRKFSASEQQSLKIDLTKDEQQMQNVVVTALGIKRAERALGYATTTIEGKQLTDAMSGNWTDALSGKVAGLNLVRSNGGPAGSNKIILRGENNLTGNNEALIVVDGVVINRSGGVRTGVGGESAYGTSSENMPADYGTSLNDINPEDIESVTVLKGPGAAALYGQDAANGAIIITTKAGNSKKKGWGVTLNSNVNWEQVNRWPDLQFEYGIGLDGQADYDYGKSANSTSSSAYGPRFDGQMFYQYNNGLQGRDTVATPWVPYKNKIREFFDVGSTITNTISVDGGTDKTTARFSVTNVTNKWIIPNTGYKRNTISLSVNSKINDRLQISSRINYTNKWSDNLPGSGYGNQSIMYWYIFWQPNADIDWLKNYWVKGQNNTKIFYPYSSFPENPYAVVNEFINRTNRHGVTGNVQATYNFTKELSLMLRTSMDLGYDQRAQERPYDAGSKFPYGSYRTQNIFTLEASSDWLLKYSKRINSDFDFSITGGGSALRNNYNRDETRADSLTNPGVYSFANAAGPLVTLPYKTKLWINSFYGVFTTSFRDYLYLDITGRQDWNSALATPKRTTNAGFFYPSANVSFVASQAFKLPKDINFLKLRFSASNVGSGQTIPYRTSLNYPSAGSLYNGGLENSTSLNNPDLRPLRTITYEGGVAMKMFKDRLGVDVAVYSGFTKDQILYRQLDRSSGYATAIINVGKVANRGVEVALNGTPVVTKSGFKWSTNIVFSANENTVKELPDSSIVLQTGPVGGGQIVAKVGGSMGDLYGRGYVRSPDGQIVYDASTGVALISQDVQYLGNTIPKWKVGFTNDFTFQQFHLGFLFDAQYGAVAHSLMHYKLAEQGKLTKTLPGRYAGIIGNGVIQGTDGKYRKNDVISMDIDEYYRSHFGVDNAEGSTFRTDYIKFREARLDYTLKPSLAKKLGMQKATIGVYGRNLFIWSDWPMFDPEFGTLQGSDIVQGFEIAQFPSTRSFGVNLVVGF
ncbi:SusC/RagA family TonB-linked outer membrane protein [Paraflavitalea sp. CAU 1676]|uniref:SusC/RagA family TonB-linked outer membrane protein n=1 Tax=Paraflavitalea sp. CAU 1676 TaxID=3032598 RepID=UPI0023DB69AB|nr:SusC/RagA family TonB-linked outer membrane protein [Paraflavitalea sp. CAU 1676]MDF2192297.1 SusC/RagA family TonB-linked outer membrane protein [Paraflavitalea sp. CAU 1676]